MKIIKNIDEFVKENELKKYFSRLYPICRSILGKGFRRSLDIIGEIVDLNKFEVKSGANILDWTVPDEWNIKDAYIVTPLGKKIAQFKKHTLHVVNYSIPVNKKISFDELKKHLYFLPEKPNAIPYVTSYYNRTWGFCISYNQYKKLTKGTYKVFIDSNISPGKLVYSNKLIPGKSKKEILLSTYLCHPQMANHEIAGPLVWSMLYKILKKTGPHNFSYRFLICPENIGSAAFLHYSKKKVKNIIAGYVINFVGHGKELTYKKSRIGNSLADSAAENILEHSNFPVKTIDFFPDGSDERQFCSPGFNLPIGLIMRKAYGKFKEYHTSLDNPKMVSFKTIIETIKIYHEVLLTIENNFIPIGKVQFGSPQLSKSKIPLYGKIMFRTPDLSVVNDNSHKHDRKDIERTRFILEVLNLADGSIDLLEIAKKKKFKLIDHLDSINDLLKSKYIKKSN